MNLLGRIFSGLISFALRWRCLTAFVIVVVAAIVTAIGMFYVAPDKLKAIVLKINGETDLAAKFLPNTLPALSKVEQAYWLPQNWSPTQRYWFHHASQGTVTIPVPYDWFVALDRPVPSVVCPPGV